MNPIFARVVIKLVCPGAGLFGMTQDECACPVGAASGADATMTAVRSSDVAADTPSLCGAENRPALIRPGVSSGSTSTHTDGVSWAFRAPHLSSPAPADQPTTAYLIGAMTGTIARESTYTTQGV